MTSKADVQEFYRSQPIAVVGASRNPQKFGNSAYKSLKAQGYKVIPVNPNTDTIEGDKTYPDLKSIPGEVGGVLVIVPPKKTEQVVQEAHEAGIQRVWLQQGAESPAAIKYCQENGMTVVHNECIMMFSDHAAWFHRAHGFVWNLMGKTPK
jgi:predicted CoA-binding protein